MDDRLYNYSAFYVEEPFSLTNLGAYASHDFIYYNMLKAWKASDSSFPFLDAHSTTYDVRDDSEWETLKDRLHKRLSVSKNIVLFLSDVTKNSDALKEEIDYGVGELGLPVIVIYPECTNKEDIAEGGQIKQQIKNLWDRIPGFRDMMDSVPTIHVPLNKTLIEKSLNDPDLTIQNKSKNGRWFY